jgi:hypothetical protein
VETVVSVVLSVVVSVLVIEFYAWLPKLATKLVEHQVRRLLVAHQERYRGEWTAEMLALPDSIAQIVFAVGLLGAAERVNEAIISSRLEKLEGIMAEVCKRHGEMVATYGDEPSRLVALKQSFASTVRETFKLSEAPKMQDSDAERAAALARLAETVQAFGSSVVTAHDTAIDHLRTAIVAVNERLGGMRQTLDVDANRLVSAQRSWTGQSLPHQTLDHELDAIEAEITGLKAMFVDDKWGDDRALSEHKRLYAVIRQTLSNVSNEFTKFQARARA